MSRPTLVEVDREAVRLVQDRDLHLVQDAFDAAVNVLHHHTRQLDALNLMTMTKRTDHTVAVVATEMPNADTRAPDPVRAAIQEADHRDVPDRNRNPSQDQFPSPNRDPDPSHDLVLRPLNANVVVIPSRLLVLLMAM